MKQVIEVKRQGREAFAGGRRRRDQLARQLPARRQTGYYHHRRDMYTMPLQGRSSTRYDYCLIGLGETIKTHDDGQQTLRRIAGERGADRTYVHRRHRRRHRYRYHRVRRVDLHARTTVRIRRLRRCWPRWTPASGAKTESTTKDTKIWSARSISPISYCATCRCCKRCPTASSGPGWPRSSKRA